MEIWYQTCALSDGSLVDLMESQPLTAPGVASNKEKFDKWERANRLSVMFMMKQLMLDTVLGRIYSCGTASISGMLRKGNSESLIKLKLEYHEFFYEW